MSKENNFKPVNVAYDEANDLLLYLKRQCDITNVCIVGELRRRVEFISEIIFLLVTDNHEEVIESLDSCSLIESIVDYSTKSFQAITVEGFLLKLFFSSSDDYEYNKFVLSASDSFLADFGSDASFSYERSRGLDEEGIFSLAQLPYLPATLREDYSNCLHLKGKDSIDVVQLSDISADLHIHSTYSDGRNSVVLLAERARSLGYSYVGISDHSQSLTVARGLSQKTLREKNKKIDQLSREYGDFDVLCGIEVDILSDGSLDYPDEVLATADYVIGSIHIETKMKYEQMTNRMLDAITSGKIDILGHPTGRMFDIREGLDFDLDAVMAACAKHRVAMEISGYTKRLDLNDVLAAKAKAMGCVFACGTDAHYIDCLEDMKYAVWMAQRAWLSKDDIINCLDINSFRNFIKTRRLENFNDKD